MATSTLLVIIDPTQQSQPALVRARDIAQQLGGHLHVFCCDYVKEEDLGKFKSKSDAKRKTLKKAKELVAQLCEPLKAEGLSISTEVIWNQGWYQAAVHAAAREGADLIIKSSFSHKGRQHPLHERSDFYLIRNSTCPILMTKSGESHKLEKVLAAVALEEGKEGHDSLNNRLVSQAQRICRMADAELHLVAALENAPDLPGLLNMLIDEELMKKSEAQLIAERFGVPAKHVHVGKGAPHDVIVKTAEKLGVQALVLGTKARKGLKGALLGNTAEKILDRLEIDVLVIN